MNKNQPTPKQEQAIREYLQEAIIPLIEQVLVKKLGQAMTFAAQEVLQPKREWVGLTDDEVSKLIDNEIGFNSCCGWEEAYTRAVEAKLKEKNT